MVLDRQMAILRRYVIASAIALFVLLLLFTCNHMASASSGGVMGGSFFNSDSESESSASEVYTRDSESYRIGHHHYYYAPSPDTGLAKGSHSGLVLFLVATLGMFLVAFYKDSNRNSVTVLKLQVAMLGGGMGSSIQRDLTRIAETADTSSLDGVSYLLTDTIQSLVRHLGYCIAGYSFVGLSRSKADGEKYYNQLSNEERLKFDEETLINLNNTEKRIRRTESDVFSKEYSVFDEKGIKEERKKIEEEKLLNGFDDKYIVITILVAAKGAHEIPNINGAEDLKMALKKLRTLLSSKLLAGKVLWTPQNEDDNLSKRNLLEDYPQLAKGMKTFLVKKHE
ncbi:hypothetical protein VNO78_28052 [Psophocarpus tetragonolobus]|uniref:Uncharacterized protein n=1 Tax=Psophocarpus tetragonolobus TaxID=3891 RepID=A0AAN9XBX6_PSOTE